ncbi:MAG: hypothetical protein CL910_19295 [Deltaproteobacteria bacterium]|jgi:peptidoglycan/xylan/chitin deacetylase (PgdA/CDA1 family)|nr:hypothetical protein [Deltaproteobacteria bacterium]
MSLKHRLRDVGAQLLWSSGLTRPSRAGRDRLNIVTFHRVLPDPAASPLPHLAVTPDFLRNALRFFAQHYTCLTLSEAAKRFFDGDQPARPLLAVTFDDGRKDNFLHGVPALRAAGIRATFFVPAGRVDDTTPLWHDELGWLARHLLEEGQGDLLGSLAGRAELADRGVHAVVQHAKGLPGPERESLLTFLRQRTGGISLPQWEGPMPWSELRQLMHEGYEIGSHSLSHDVLLDRLGADQRAEVFESKRLLEENLNTEVKSFCFPTGEYDATTLGEIREAGYQCAVTTRPGSNSRDSDPYELLRHDIQGERNRVAAGAVHVPVLAWRLSDFPGTAR